MNWELKVGSIDRNRNGTVSLEVYKSQALAIIFYFNNFWFRQGEHDTLQERCGLCKYVADFANALWFGHSLLVSILIGNICLSSL